MFKSRRIMWEGHVARTGDKRIQILVWKPERKRLPGLPKHGLEYNIKMDFRERRRGGVD
jgi:hypothetical protein